MVRIDNKIREIVNAIKQEEAKIANLANKIDDAARSFSSYLIKSYVWINIKPKHRLSCTLEKIRV